MKKSLFIILIFITPSLSSFCQTTQFENYKIKDFGYISIPSNLELQSGIYKRFAENFQISIGTIDYEILDKRAVFQQKGVNSGEKTNTYARVIIKTFIDNFGDYEYLENATSPTQSELQELNSIFQSGTEDSFIGTPLTLLNWYGTEWVKINDFYALKVSYLRKLQGKPPVYVEIFRIQNNDRLHEVIMSFRQEDRNIWQPLYKKIRESIKVNIIH